MNYTKILFHYGLCQTGHCARFVLSAKLQPAGMPMSVQRGDDRWCRRILSHLGKLWCLCRGARARIGRGPVVGTALSIRVTFSPMSVLTYKSLRLGNDQLCHQ
ncbi:hypothetical protein P171DRAFT_132318 [Karstenula rhodostoma CBS 690.94]|uniref:Uncharacterized protein n=1 Tax=Karstenula rhodostoma CBS 690.94 TaxID=1392251 RepID=A0A9P4P969_9PLEO|nr:hypothetical protein P171DRAFT_132318 [Karstenula rhodostoma CBS 690.94]